MNCFIQYFFPSLCTLTIVRCIKIEDKECEFNKNFHLILHTKLANPHYQPELQAQTTLINFTVTRDGLEEQLLAEVVSVERPDLEKLKVRPPFDQSIAVPQGLSPALIYPVESTEQ